MIEAIIFDFGDIFINLDKNAIKNQVRNLGLTQWNNDLQQLNLSYEKGQIKEPEFLSGIQKHIPKASVDDIKKAWNSILKDFPLYRLEFLQLLRSKYKLYLLSNTDATHIEHFEQREGISFVNDFYSCFEKVYFSFEIGMRKPDEDIFKFVLNNHNLVPKKTLFVDDKSENIETAENLGIQVWHLQVGKEDVIELLDKKIIR